MILKDISTETESLYTLAENEKAVFFLLNRSGDITFDLSGPGSAAHIFAFFLGKDTDKETLRITQKHSARNTTSHASVKTALFGQSEFTYEGMIHIEKSGRGSKASQEGRALLASPDTKAFFRPSLEILPEDVECRHAATVSPLNQEAIYFLKSRGLTEQQAKRILIEGFFKYDIEKIESLGVSTENILPLLEKTLIHTL